MKNILVIYSSQSGQMGDILNSICADIKDKTVLHFHKIELENSFPFPWKAYDTFFDAMPETVLGIAQAIKPMQIDTSINYDLVILGYQPWFLSPSVPFNSFLKSEYASVLKNKPVVTVIGCRNMWLRAQEIVKNQLEQLGAKLVGNIVLEDKHDNWASTMSIVRWVINGQKEADQKYPEAGVSQVDINASKRFGAIILNALEQNNLNNLHSKLLEADAINLRPNLIVMENNGAKQFPKWANKAYNAGLKSAEKRKKVIKNFMRLLFVAVYILSPVSGTMAKVKTMLKKSKLEKDLAYFKSNQYRAGMI